MGFPSREQTDTKLPCVKRMPTSVSALIYKVLLGLYVIFEHFDIHAFLSVEINMQSIRSISKDYIMKTLMLFLFYLQFLVLINKFVNKFCVRKNTHGLLRFPFIKRKNFNNVQIFAYHRVNNQRDPFFRGISIDTFKKQIEYIAYRFNVLSLEDAVEQMRREDVVDNAIVITFDDGYRDVYLHAFPILKQFSIPATVFLPTAVIGSGQVLWHDRVFSAFRETREPFLKEYGKNPKTYPMRILHEKLLTLYEILQFLRSLDGDERSFWIERLVDNLCVTDIKETPNLMLTWDDVKHMHENGLYFGSHTVTHPILSRTPCDEIRKELYESKNTIEENLCSPVRTFAYPVGRREDFNDNVKNLLKEVGYICALTMIFGTNEPRQDLFSLRRGQPWEEHLPTFATKLHWYKLSS